MSEEEPIMSTTQQRVHAAHAEYEPTGGHGYPWRPTCSCGWNGRHMLTQDAAQAIAADHAERAS